MAARITKLGASVGDSRVEICKFANTQCTSHLELTKDLLPKARNFKTYIRYA